MDRVNIVDDLAERGVKHYVLQAFHNKGCVDVGLWQSAMRDRPFTLAAASGAGRHRLVARLTSETARRRPAS
jgi:hypothetical protein